MALKFGLLPSLPVRFRDRKQALFPGEDADSLVVCFQSELHQQDCDCACSYITQHPLFFCERTPVYRIEVEGVYTERLNDGYTLFYPPTPFATPAILNKPALSLLEALSTPHTPEEAAARLGLPPEPVLTAAGKMAQAGLLRPLGANRESIAPRERVSPTLTLWLHLTSACNLRCAYCYVAKTPARMDVATACGAIDRAVQKLRGHPGARLRLKYAGGEPLLALDTLKAIHRYATEKASQSGVQLSEVVLTNGTLLTRDVLAYLEAEGLEVMVSVDGLSAAHDVLRPYADGAGSMQDVLSGLELLRAAGITPCISMTITALNLREIPPMVDFAMERGWPLSLNFYRPRRAHDSLWPEPESLTESLMEAAELIEKRVLEGGGPIPVVDRLHLGAPYEFVCDAGKSYFAVAPDGQWAPCPMLMGMPLQRKRQGRNAALAPNVESKEGCSTCTWRYLCGGGCPLLSEARYGSRMKPSPYCRVYRAVIPVWLRLKALQMLKAIHPQD